MRRSLMRVMLLAGMVCISTSLAQAQSKSCTDTTAGCTSGDPGCTDCVNGKQSSKRRGWSFWRRDKETGMRKGSPEYLCYYGSLPPGSRRDCKHGEVWPPRPRPDVPYQKFWNQYHSAHYWPHPYNLHDQQRVMDRFAMQNAAGWQQACTLYGYYFDDETNSLTTSGRRQLHWILSNAPEQLRQVYVATSSDPSMNEARLQTVKAEVAGVMGSAEGAPVMLRNALPLGRPALEVDTYQRALREGMLDPHIQYTAGAGGGSTGSGS